jgi:V/A-type H+-transporting ATPase subunit K
MNKVLVVSAFLMGAGFLAMLRARVSSHPLATLRAVVSGWLGVNGLTLVGCLATMLIALGAPTPVLAQASAAPAGPSGTALGAALSTGLACIGAGIAVGIAGAAAIGGITEKPEILGRTLIFVGLAEGIAIYGLIISFMILNA